MATFVIRFLFNFRNTVRHLIMAQRVARAFASSGSGLESRTQGRTAQEEPVGQAFITAPPESTGRVYVGLSATAALLV